MMNKKVIILIIVVVILFIFVFLTLRNKITRIVDKKEYVKQVKEEYSEIEYTIPNEFEESNYFKSYSLNSNGVYCTAYIDASKKYNDDFLNWFKGRIIVDLNTEIGSLQETTVDSKKVYSIDVKNDKRVEYYYGLESTNYYYIYEYTIIDNKKGDREDIDTNLCYQYKDVIFDSIKIK